MRFLSRGLFGMCLMMVTLALLGLAGNMFFQALQEKQAQEDRKRPTRERVFSVEVALVKLQTVRPIIETFGEVVSGQTLEVRATASGAVVQLDPDFRNGGAVTAGRLLFQIDPAATRSSLRLLETELAEAQAELAEAGESLTIAADEQIAAERQAQLRQQALQRQLSLKERGVGTAAAIETAELALSSADQAILGKRQAVANAKAKISRAKSTLSRVKINVTEAERKLADTSVYAKFDGVLSDVSVVLGGLVSANERVGQLIDPSELEVLFRVSNDEFASITAAQGGVKGADVSLSFAGQDDAIQGTVSRVSAAVGDGQTGREIFAALDPLAGAILRPGDFVGVALKEPALSGVAVIPATAVTTAGDVLLVGADLRLVPEQVRIFRKQGNQVLVDGRAIEGRQLVLKRTPQLGMGIKVDPKSPGGLAIEDEMQVQLTPEQQARILAALATNKRIPAGAKDRIIAQVKSGEIPKAMADRLDGMQGGGDSNAAAPNTAAPAAGAAGGTVSLSDSERQRLLAAIADNSDLPDAAKARMVERLSQPDLSKEAFDRINARIGG